MRGTHHKSPRMLLAASPVSPTARSSGRHCSEKDGEGSPPTIKVRYFMLESMKRLYLTGKEVDQ